MALKESKELLSFIFSSVELGYGVADGLSFDDVGKLVKAAREAGPAFDGVEKALEEYKAMNDAEALEMETYIEQEFDIPSDSIEFAIETALKVAIQLRSLAALFPKKS